MSPKRPAPRGPLKFEASFHACLPHNCPARITSSPACPSHKSPSNIVRLKRDFRHRCVRKCARRRTSRGLFPKLFPGKCLAIIIAGLQKCRYRCWRRNFFFFYFCKKSISSRTKIYLPPFQRSIENAILILYFTYIKFLIHRKDTSWINLSLISINIMTSTSVKKLILAQNIFTRWQSLIVFNGSNRKDRWKKGKPFGWNEIVKEERWARLETRNRKPHDISRQCRSLEEIIRKPDRYPRRSPDVTDCGLFSFYLARCKQGQRVSLKASRRRAPCGASLSRDVGPVV